MSLKDYAPSLRPREKAFSEGIASLSSAELVAVLLHSGGMSGVSALDLAQALLARYGSLYALSRASLADLLLLKGVGVAKASTLLSAFEVARRAFEERKDVPSFSPGQAYSLLKNHPFPPGEEQLFLARYDERERYIGLERIAQGSCQRAKERIGPLLSRVLKSGASSFVLIHNHPSGTLRPSKEDLVSTGRLLQRSREMGIAFLDHLIASESGYFSFRDRGLLAP